MIDGLGMFTIYGMIEKFVAYEQGLVPMGLTVGGKIVKPVKWAQQFDTRTLP